MAQPSEPSLPPSPALRHASAVLGDRWSLLIVAALQDGPLRFGDLALAVGAIAPNILSSRLRSLATEQVLVAEPYQLRPPRMIYDLTDAGRQLGPVLGALEVWGGAHGANGETAVGPWHDVCGSALEVHTWCPSCEAITDRSDAGGTVFL